MKRLVNSDGLPSNIDIQRDVASDSYTVRYAFRFSPLNQIFVRKAYLNPEQVKVFRDYLLRHVTDLNTTDEALFEVAVKMAKEN